VFILYVKYDIKTGYNHVIFVKNDNCLVKVSI